LLGCFISIDKRHVAVHQDEVVFRSKSPLWVPEIAVVRFIPQLLLLYVPFDQFYRFESVKAALANVIDVKVWMIFQNDAHGLNIIALIIHNQDLLNRFLDICRWLIDHHLKEMISDVVYLQLVQVNHSGVVWLPHVLKVYRVDIELLLFYAFL
jgi:hypothetical protein